MLKNNLYKRIKGSIQENFCPMPQKIAKSGSQKRIFSYRPLEGFEMYPIKWTRKKVYLPTLKSSFQ